MFRSSAKSRAHRLPLVLVLLLCVLALSAARPKRATDHLGSLSKEADRWIEKHSEQLKALNLAIWENPELGLQEHFAVEQLTGFLEEAGFSIETGASDMPTAFIASIGEGEPVIGILAEYDALPGVSQAAEPERTPRAGGADNDAGHACGHSVFGTASVAAAAAAAASLVEHELKGTIRLYGTPAEETGLGKVYMTRDGVFDDVDIMLHWHAASRNRVSFATSKAVVSVKYRFDGLSAHASLSPEYGRSALDAVELMNIGVNYLREHVVEDARIHYVITDGGGQPNVVPPTAEVWFYLRADSHADVERILQRVRAIAQGAALMSATTVTENLQTDLYELLPNQPLSELLQEHLERVGAPKWTEEELAFAKTTQADLPDVPEAPLATEVEPLPAEPFTMGASTDVGNVSWAIPTGGIGTACYTLGAPGHSWQVAACTGMSIGEKGMFVAARTLAGAALELLVDQKPRKKAAADFEARREEGEVPTSVLEEGQRPPVSIR